MYNRIRQWEPWLAHLIPQEGEMAFDVGAADGKWTLDLAERFSAVFAFEPHREAYDRLCEVKNEDSQVFIACFNLAIADSVGYREMNLYEHSDHTSFFSDEIIQAARSASLNKTMKAKTVTLDWILRETHMDGRKVDFVKVDTEGAEYLVLQGASELIVQHRPTWIIEYHSDENLHHCRSLLKGFDYIPAFIPHPHTGVQGHGWIYAPRISA